MKRRPFQYLLLIIGVALGVTMMVSVDLASASAGRAFELSTDAVAGRTTHRIVGGPAGLDEDVYRQLRTELGYDRVAPLVEGYLIAQQLGDRPMRLIGVDPFAEPPFRNYFDEAQSVPGEGLTSLLTEPNTVLLSEEQADRFSLPIGATLTLDLAGKDVLVRLVGLLRPADAVSARALESLIFTDIATAQEILGLHGRLSHIDLIVDDQTILPTLEDMLPAGARLETAKARSNAVRQLADAFQLNLTALSLLALVVGMFLIYNTVTFSVVQRRRWFGVLRCLGVTGDQLFLLILSEAAVLSLIGAVLGIGTGILLGRSMVQLVSQTINDFYFVVSVQSVALPAWTIAKGLVVGVVAAVVASTVPAWEAKSIAPQSSLHRSTLERRAQRAVRWLFLLFIALVGVGSILLWLSGLNLVITFVGLFAVLIAFAFLTPGLTIGLMQFLTPLGGRLFGAIGRMAPRDIVRSLSRTSVAIAALMIAIAVIVGVSIMIGSFRQTVAEWLGSTLQADVYLSPPTLTASRVAGTLDPEVVKAARDWPDVAKVVTAWHTDVMAVRLGRPLEVVAVDGDISDGNRSYAWINGDRSDLWQRLANGEGVLVSEPLIIREDLGIPPAPITLMTENGPHEFPILAVFYDYSSDQGSILMAQDLYADWWGNSGVTSMGLFAASEQDAERITGELQAYFRGRDDVIVQSNRVVRSNALDIFDRTFAITAALQLLAVTVAFIGVLSSLMSLQLERTRELGVLRATGMTVRQLWQLTLLETGMMGGTAGLLAMPVGLVLAWILIYVINRRSFGWTLQINLEPEYFLQGLVIAFIAAILAGIYPALRLGRMIIAQAIREE